MSDLHPQDAERLEELEECAKSSAWHLEGALANAEAANDYLEVCRANYAQALKDRDSFKAAMESMVTK